MKPSDRADVWVLLGPHRGDNHQVLALAESLGLKFRPIQMHYRWFATLAAVSRAATISHLSPEAQREITSPWPSLVLGIGQRSGPVARYIKRASGGRTTVIRLGDPIAPPRLFDAVITTRQYAVPDADNVMRLPITICRSGMAPNRAEEHWLQGFARPRRLVVIGGTTSLWRLGPRLISQAIRTLKRRTGREGGSIIAVTSPRTSSSLVAAAQEALGQGAVVAGRFPRYQALLSAADEIHVTGDSVSMLSEAVATGKPVGLIPLDVGLDGKLIRVAGAILGRPLPLRRLEKFWDDLRTRGLVGTIEQPRAGKLDAQPIDTAVAAIRTVMGERPKLIVTTSVPSHQHAAAAPAAQAARG